jgi:hypothetical protein
MAAVPTSSHVILTATGIDNTNHVSEIRTIQVNDADPTKNISSLAAGGKKTLAKDVFPYTLGVPAAACKLTVVITFWDKRDANSKKDDFHRQVSVQSLVFKVG